jgi:lysozyme
MTETEIEQCKAQIRYHEGLRLKAYRDTLEYWTIGFGHLLNKGSRPKIEMITRDEAETLFDGDFLAALNDATALVDTEELNAPRFAVAVNMAFNLGFEKLKGFRETLAAINSGEYARAADCMLASRWAKQVGKRAIELSEQMRKGEWQGGAGGGAERPPRSGSGTAQGAEEATPPSGAQLAARRNGRRRKNGRWLY